MISIELSKEQEAAIVAEHGSIAYATTYLSQYADYLIGKQIKTARDEKITKLMSASDTVLDEAVAKAELEKKG